MHTLGSLLVLAALLQSCAHAAAPPPRELVHPFPPGGLTEVIGATRASRTLRAMQRYASPAFTDLLAAHVANTLQGSTSERVAVTRRHRRGGNEASASVASAPADGRALLLTAIPITPVRAQASAAARLDTVAFVARMPYAWVSHDSRDLAELLRGGTRRLLTAHPGERTVAYWPLGRLRDDPAIALEPVAYNGGVAALNALAGGQVAAALVPLPAALPYTGSGRLRLLAIADAKRHETLPHVPTTAEAGLDRAEAVLGFEVLAPSGTHASLLRPIGAALSRVAEAEDTRTLLLGYGLRLEYRSAAQQR